MTAKMCHPSAKSTVAKATADSPASTDVTSPSLTEPASLDTAPSPSHKSSFPIPSTERQGQKALNRFDKIMEDMEKKSPEEITAFIQKYGPKSKSSRPPSYVIFLLKDNSYPRGWPLPLRYGRRYRVCHGRGALDIFVTGERSISKQQMEEMLQVQMFTAEDLFPLWKNGTGLCTSFAIYIASRLENSDHPTLFQFAELNGIHRACFSRDGTIIDSSARKILEVKDEKPISGYKGHWNLDKSSNDLTLLFKVCLSYLLVLFLFYFLLIYNRPLKVLNSQLSSPYRAMSKQCITVYFSSAIRNPFFVSSGKTPTRHLYF